MPLRRLTVLRPHHVLLTLLPVTLTVAGWSPAAQAAARLGDRTLERPARGADVRELQRTLRRLHHPVSVDGRFGVATERAVRRYERRVHIAADGVVTSGEARGMRARAGTLAFGGRTLRRGDRGKDVRRLQQILTATGRRTPVDGRFGRITERHVRRWEAAAGLSADGRVTPAEAQQLAAAVTAAPDTARDGALRFPIAGPFHHGGAGTDFGDRGGRHHGVDLFAGCGTAVVAPQAATVRRVAFEADAGNYAVVRLRDSGEDLVLMHLRRPASVRRGEALAGGEAIGEVGATGNADGCHLHLEIWTAPGWYSGGRPRDPSADLARWG